MKHRPFLWKRDANSPADEIGGAVCMRMAICSHVHAIPCFQALLPPA